MAKVPVIFEVDDSGLKEAYANLTKAEKEQIRVLDQVNSKQKEIQSSQKETIEGQKKISNQRKINTKIIDKQVSQETNLAKKRTKFLGDYKQRLIDLTGINKIFGSQLDKLRDIQDQVNNVFGQFSSVTKKSTESTKKATLASQLLGKAMLSIPVVAIVAALGSLVTYFTRSQKGADQFSKALAGITQTGEVLLDRLLIFGEGLTLLFTDPAAAVDKFKEAFTNIGQEIEGETKIAIALREKQIELEKIEIAFIKERAQLEVERAKREESAAQNRDTNTKQAIADLNRVIEINKQIAETEEDIRIRRFADLLGLVDLGLAREKYNQLVETSNQLTIEELGLNASNREDLREANELIAEAIGLRATEANNNRRIINQRRTLERQSTTDLEKEAKERDAINKAILKEQEEDYKKSLENQKEYQKEAEELLEMFKKQREDETIELPDIEVDPEADKAIAEERADVYKESFFKELRKEIKITSDDFQGLFGDDEDLGRLFKVLKVVQSINQAREAKKKADENLTTENVSTKRSKLSSAGSAVSGLLSGLSQFKDGGLVPSNERVISINETGESEFVVNAKRVKDLGVKNLEALNNGASIEDLAMTQNAIPRVNNVSISQDNSKLISEIKDMKSLMKKNFTTVKTDTTSNGHFVTINQKIDNIEKYLNLRNDQIYID